jgi:hypothetical protein
MRITDIIAEAGPTSYVPASPTSPIVVPTPVTPTPAPAAPTPTPRAPKTTGDKVKQVSRIFSKKYGPRVKHYVTRGDLKEKGAGRFARAAGSYLRLLKWIGFYDFGVQYWTNTEALEAMEKAGELQGDDLAAAKRMMVEELVVEVMASNAFPTMIRWILRLRWLKLIPQAIGGLGVLATGGLATGAEVAIILATEAASIALQNWLKTPDGQETVAYIVLYAVDPGYVWLYNQGPGRFWGKIKGISPEGFDKVQNRVNPDGHKPDKPKPDDNKPVPPGQGGQDDNKPFKRAPGDDPPITINPTKLPFSS